MKRLLFLLIVFTSYPVCDLSAQSGWYALSNTPIVNTVAGLKFINQNTGYAACDGGKVAKTTNGGVNWIIIGIAPDTVNFQSLCFLNESTGYIIGNGKLFKTISAGMNWDEIITGVWEPVRKNSSVYFLNENTGFISGGTYSTSFFKKTTDGGNTWVNKTSAVGVDNLNSSFGQVLFVNANTGFIIKDSYIFKTTTAGNTWDSLAAPGLAYALAGIQFVNEIVGYAVGENGRFLKTTNGGNNWTAITLPVLPPPFSFAVGLKCVNFISESTGFICGNYGYIAKSTNAGANWTIQNIANTGYLNSVLMTSPATGCAVGVNGSILTTTNGGLNWDKQYSGYPEVGFRDVYSLDSITTFAVTDNVYRAGSRIYSTTNGGLEWTYKNSGYTVPLNGITFTSANTGFIIGDSNKVLKTTNRGENWVLKTPALTENRLFSIFFVNSNIGYISGKFGWSSSSAPFILRTINGGENWTTLQIPGVESFQYMGDLFFLNTDTGFVCGEQGNIYKTTNRGLNWTTINAGFTHANDDIFSIFFTSVSTGYLVGNHYDPVLNINLGKVAKTTNGGLNWSIIPLPAYIEGHGKFFNKIRFINSNTGYMAGNNTGIIKTTDAGNTWFRETAIGPSIFHSISFLNGTLGYAVGEGIILKTSPLTGIQTIQNNITDSYSLNQNYPNPFNPVTLIRYNLSKSGFVTLKIFNTAGKEVARLVNKYNQAGNYEVRWDASQYASGVYFYKIDVNDFSQVKKMILLK